ncbi:cell envelope-related function transcriptional attenuator common domain-containing protein [Nonomuraea maritima]|uniref:Cell envelope-related function transcriptional attenuator common domain-containing protein n=1 Tax=Nonomuraea maritima TaxID=683260 RepID=A0A1G9L6G4_9ACTN|nr:LCP family protein [Nonomuraea maritima]SDL57337.1 cell envelope-related function transcriptional attenuator common domain-containing protein [Nonomuraea maritima]
MDDLKLLHDLGAQLEHQPPPTLVRQRERLLDGSRRRRAPHGRIAGWWAAGLVAVATAFAVAVPVVLVAGGRDRNPAVVATEPADMSGALNVLLVGSDTREGEGNAEYGPRMADAGARADTIWIAHLPADRTTVTVVSVPRDSIVRIPRCGSSPARTDLINSAYRTGGLTCLRTTLEELTGLRLNHAVEVDFSGFKEVVDALGGVTVTLPLPVNDRAAKLKLPAGTSHLNGEEALGYVRLRRYGDGSDVARIKRQYTLVRAMLRKARSTLDDPGTLKAALTAVRSSVRTDLSVESMYQLATELSRARFTPTTVPWQPHPDDPNRLVWKQPDADRLFAGLR